MSGDWRVSPYSQSADTFLSEIDGKLRRLAGFPLGFSVCQQFACKRPLLDSIWIHPILVRTLFYGNMSVFLLQNRKSVKGENFPRDPFAMFTVLSGLLASDFFPQPFQSETFVFVTTSRPV